MKLKKGDQVKIISGNDKGKQGRVLAVLPSVGKILVEGINMKKKHVRPRRQDQKGELVKIYAPFPAARAMIVCPKCAKASRTGYRVEGMRKDRICRKCGAEI